MIYTNISDQNAYIGEAGNDLITGAPLPIRIIVCGTCADKVRQQKTLTIPQEYCADEGQCVVCGTKIIDVKI